jgi:hypothetical protein
MMTIDEIRALSKDPRPLTPQETLRLAHQALAWAQLAQDLADKRISYPGHNSNKGVF